MIQNPILPGFHADPCICRKGNDFYIAVSSFEWFPGNSHLPFQRYEKLGAFSMRFRMTGAGSQKASKRKGYLGAVPDLL